MRECFNADRAKPSRGSRPGGESEPGVESYPIAVGPAKRPHPFERTRSQRFDRVVVELLEYAAQTEGPFPRPPFLLIGEIEVVDLRVDPHVIESRFEKKGAQA